jgi:trehalose 6-phosphate phosphatase
VPKHRAGPAHATSTSGPDFDDALARLARTPRLLVCCDYDGTLAPIVSDPSVAYPMPEAIAALRTLTAIPETKVAVVSGRSLRDLAALTRLPSEVHLIGSHGTEFDLGFVQRLQPEEQVLQARLREYLIDRTREVPGVLLEYKPAAVAVHVRNATDTAAAKILSELEIEPGGWPNVYVTYGKKLIEFSVVRGDKGDALNRLRHDFAPSATLFIGDDVTDETAFAQLSGPDVGVKVGSGETIALFRLSDPAEVVVRLAQLQEARHAWFTGGHADPIEEHSLLADGVTVALLSPRGSISWLCHPDPDGAAMFASLLGDESAGHFTIRPLHGGEPLSQNYATKTMTVRTRFAGLTIVDYLDTERGPLADGTHVSRLIRVLSGSARSEVVFAPRPEFGQATVQLESVPDGIVVHGGSELVVLRSPGVSWEIRGKEGWHEAVAQLDPSQGDIVLELRLGTGDLAASPTSEPEVRGVSQRYWSEWLDGLKLPTYERDAVARSALTLRALCHVPTGGIMAAATLGLPEWIGGIRNWDYRFVWIRDAAIISQTLLALGSVTEADAYLGWLCERFVASGNPENLHPLYALRGSGSPPEAALESLPGYAGSRPVRVGNAAQGQAQLDVFGAVCNLIAARAVVRGWLTDDERWLVETSVAAVALRWREPDHGIWEIRDSPRHHTHSKMMCWVAVDRGIAACSADGGCPAEWAELRSEIAADVLQNGWDPALASFVSAYDRREIDAAVLQPLGYGFPASIEQVAGTIHAIESTLRRGASVYRYRFNDGLPGDEGAMHICAAWLIEAYVLTGQLDDAEELFSGILAAAGRTGLLSEQVDPRDLRGLGNHPQAYSHVGLIAAALAMDRLK